VGRYFALLEAQVILAALLRRLDLAAAPGGDMKLRQLFTLASTSGIPIVPSARAQPASAA
jgi:cytochrome P450